MRTTCNLFNNSFSTARLSTIFCAASLAMAIACGGSAKPEPAAPTTTEKPEPTAVTPDPGSDTMPAATAADPELVAKGAAVYEEYCGICHGDAGAGTKKSPMIKGAGSNEKFSSTEELFEYVKKEMPKDDPGSLSADEYKAVVAWMQS